MYKMDVQIEPEIKSIEDFIKKFSSLSKQELSGVADIIRDSIKDNIFKGVNYMGGAVKPLSALTVKLKGSARPLYTTGELYNSIFKGESGDFFDIFVKGARSLIAAKLNDGYGRIPKREFFGISKAALAEIDKFLSKEK